MLKGSVSMCNLEVSLLAYACLYIQWKMMTESSSTSLFEKFIPYISYDFAFAYAAYVSMLFVSIVKYTIYHIAFSFRYILLCILCRSYTLLPIH